MIRRHAIREYIDNDDESRIAQATECKFQAQCCPTEFVPSFILEGIVIGYGLQRNFTCLQAASSPRWCNDAAAVSEANPHTSRYCSMRSHDDLVTILQESAVLAARQLQWLTSVFR
jgi:hypothetical protein